MDSSAKVKAARIAMHASKRVAQAPATSAPVTSFDAVLEQVGLQLVRSVLQAPQPAKLTLDRAGPSEMEEEG